MEVIYYYYQDILGSCFYFFPPDVGSSRGVRQILDQVDDHNSLEALAWRLLRELWAEAMGQFAAVFFGLKRLPFLVVLWPGFQLCTFCILMHFEPGSFGFSCWLGLGFGCWVDRDPRSPERPQLMNTSQVKHLHRQDLSSHPIFWEELPDQLGGINMDPSIIMNYVILCLYINL